MDEERHQRRLPKVLSGNVRKVKNNRKNGNDGYRSHSVCKGTGIKNTPETEVPERALQRRGGTGIKNSPKTEVTERALQRRDGTGIGG